MIDTVLSQYNSKTRLRADNFTSTAAIAAHTTNADGYPSGDGAEYGVIRMCVARLAPVNIKLMPFGTGSAGQTFVMRVTGYSLLDQQGIPEPLAEFVCTLGSQAGPGTGELYCSAIQKSWGSELIDVVETGGLASTILMDVRGNTVLLVEFQRLTASAANVLWQKV